MKAVILAGGEGKRLMPLTSETPKPLLKIKGMSIIERLVRDLEKLDVSETIIAIRNKSVIKDYLDSKNFSMKLTYVTDDTQNTAHALFASKSHLGNEKFILLFGDTVMTFDEMQKMVIFSKKCDCDILAGMSKRPVGSHMLQVGDNNKVLKMGYFKGNYYGTGIRILWPSVIKDLPEKEDEMAKFKSTSEFIGFLIEKGYRTVGFELDKIFDVDTHDVMKEAKETFES